MKREKGITLISLIIYIIVLLLVLTMLTKITSSLYFNVKEIDSDFDIAVDIAKFNMYFLNDIKNKSVTANVIDKNTIELIYSDNSEKITYKGTSGALYRNKVKVLDNLDAIEITEMGKNIQVYLKIGNYSKTTSYIIEPKPI